VGARVGVGLDAVGAVTVGTALGDEDALGSEVGDCVGSFGPHEAIDRAKIKLKMRNGRFSILFAYAPRLLAEQD
jgi:hypothetical protein